jgi:hypothetical protein
MDNRSWLSKPENITSLFVGLLIAAGAVWGGIHLLPFLILATTNIIYEGILLAALGLMVFAVLDKDVHRIFYYGWKMMTRRLTGLLIDMDPISAVETSLGKMQSRLDEAVKNKNDVGGQLRALEEKIKSNATRAEMNMRKAQHAEKQGDLQGKTLMALEAQGLMTSNKNLTETRNKVAMMKSVLDNMCGAVDFNIKKTRSELEIKKEERKVIMSAHRAMTLGQKVLGRSPEKEMFDRAMESMSQTANRQLAEIDHIMNASEGVLRGVDLEKGIMQEDALKALQQWEKGGSTLLGTTKTVLIEQSNDPSFLATDVTPKATVKQDRFKNLLE